MKIILSRKGFDSSSAGCPSPILPDGTMLSMPIPTDDRKYKYSDLSYNGLNYAELINTYNPKFKKTYCHLDPDIRDGLRKTPDDWIPAFGQTDAAQTNLSNSGVGEGDIFLFFGLFHRLGNNLKFNYEGNDFYSKTNIHAIYGYLQVGQIVGADNISKYPWHPHAGEGYKPNNTLYLPSPHLVIDGKIYGDGSGVFDYDRKRVLTLEGCTCANWIPLECLMPKHLSGNRKNSSKCDALYYRGQWQELVFDTDNNPQIVDWVKGLF